MDDATPIDLTPPFALLRREGRARIELLRGETMTVERLADLPPADQLALVPYRQLRERGDACHDDGTPLVTLLVRQHLAHDRRGKDEPHGEQAKPCGQPPM